MDGWIMDGNLEYGSYLSKVRSLNKLPRVHEG